MAQYRWARQDGLIDAKEGAERYQDQGYTANDSPEDAAGDPRMIALQIVQWACATGKSAMTDNEGR